MPTTGKFKSAKGGGKKAAAKAKAEAGASAAKKSRTPKTLVSDVSKYAPLDSDRQAEIQYMYYSVWSHIERDDKCDWGNGRLS